MWLAPRFVRQTSDQKIDIVENLSKALEEFHDKAAWVLLGEPGSGKSTTFEDEAKATGGLFLSIAEFMHGELGSEWQEKTLFLDGLDEVRAGAVGDSVLFQLRTRLKQLGNPKFRISCRAADWFGATDRGDIEGASIDGQIVVLVLEPLGQNDIIEILRNNHGEVDPQGFVETAKTRGVDGLLDNPQTLGLLAQAISGAKWPETRQETFLLACKKLVEEDNKRHRKAQRIQPTPVDRLLDAAGQLCAVLLLSDKTGIALDPESADERFPILDDFAPPDQEAALQTLRRKLFRPHGEERVVPSHRSVAEYLAARWLAQRIDCQGLPLGRVLNLLLGRDGRTVAGLRGLYGWLALHCHKVRARLLAADPLTAVIYGDVKPIPSPDKRLILKGLREEAQRHTAFLWDAANTDRFGDLADPELVEDFIVALESPERDDATEAFASCILVILDEGIAPPDLSSTMKRLVLDETHKGHIRERALKIWLKQGVDYQEALALLDAITENRISDPEDELAGLLLPHLYPESIAPEILLHYLHVPKNEHLIGSYMWFWEHDLPQRVPETHLSIILDGLAGNFALRLEHDEFHRTRMVSRLLVRGIALFGERISDERLFGWLGIGADEYGNIKREESDRQAVASWLESRPERYKALLAICFSQCNNHENPYYCIGTQKHRLHEVTVPADIGLWHLEQASIITDPVLAEIHLGEAVHALMFQRGAGGLSLEKIEAWSDAHPERKSWLIPLLAWEIPDWRIEDAARKQSRIQATVNRRQECSKNLRGHLDAILAGTANAALLHQLAGVWMDHYSDTRGDTPLARFESYCANGEEILELAEVGFRHCPERSDLPTVAEIVDLGIQRKQHFISNPCLVGMELRWRDGVTHIDSLADEILRRMLAFRLTYGADNTPAWFTYLVISRPVLVADVLVDYAGTTLKSRQDFIYGIYPLGNDPNYRDVACLAVPRLLECFPLRAKSALHHHLETLLKAALRYSLEQLPALIQQKSLVKGMDAAQKVYWLTTGMLLDPGRYETALWAYIGKSLARANRLSGFLSHRYSGLNVDFRLSARTLGKLIELLAPHAEIGFRRGGGLVNEAEERGIRVRAMITSLGALGTDDAAQEIERLLRLPALRKLKISLESARHQLQLIQRESMFSFPLVSGVAQILSNKEPASPSDLAALVVDHLDDIALAIRRENDDGFRSFWNIENKKPTDPREENLCRDVLLTRLRACLEPFGIDCQPEADYVNDKRADIRVSVRNEFELPIEIKRESNDFLWSALHTQLVEQYAISPKTGGYGIYLVLWFGRGDIPPARDGGKKPRSPEELKARLEATLNATERQHIFVRVTDVSWPVPKK